MFKKIFSSNPSKAENNSRFDAPAYQDINSNRCKDCKDKLDVYSLLATGKIDVDQIKPTFVLLEYCKGCRDVQDIRYFASTLLSYINDFGISTDERSRLINRLIYDALYNTSGSSNPPDFYFYLFVKTFISFDRQINPGFYNNNRLLTELPRMNNIGKVWETKYNSTTINEKTKEYADELDRRVQRIR